MDAECVGGAASRAVFGELLELVIDVTNTTTYFRSKLNLIKQTLVSITKSKINLDVVSGEIAMFLDQLEDGKKLLRKCSKVRPWDLWRKYVYSVKLSNLQAKMFWFFQVHLQAQLACDGKKTLMAVDDLRDKFDRALVLRTRGYCDVPGLLKDGVNVVVLSGPGGYGKTTLSKMLCKDGEIQGIYGRNTFFVNVSKTANLKDIILRIFQHEGLPLPQFQSEEDAINQLETLMRNIVQVDQVLSIIKKDDGGGSCDVPRLPDLVVGLDEPLEELKTMLLKNGVDVVVLSAPGGCGKTTLSKMLCKDKEIQGIYGSNTFFVTVSKAASLKDIIQKIFHHKGLPAPRFQSEEDAINQLESLMNRFVEDGSILLVLDDVWSEWESLIEKFCFKIDNYKILVSSRFVFPRFDHTYKLNILNDKDAMTLFCHSALRKDDNTKIPDEVLNEIVKGCKGFPLALTVIGRSLYGKHFVSWERTQRNWSQGQSIFCSHQKDLLMPLQTSLDALEENAIAKECYLDLGSFPEDQKIAASVLMDMWVELYSLDDEGIDSLENLFELSFRNLVNLLRTRKGTIEVDGYCNELYVVQHDLLRELAIYQSSQKPIEQRKRLIMDIRGNAHPQWLVEQQQQPKHARLLSISTDETFTSSWYNMQLPSTEVLILNFRSKNYILPHFIEKMDKLKVLIITNYSFYHLELNNFLLLGYLTNLKRIRLERISIPSLNTSLLQLKNLQKISLIMCEISKAFGSYTVEIPQMLPNLLELEIECCDDLIEFPIGFCNLLCLKKLSITYCNELSVLPNAFGRLVTLEVLRIHSCTKLEELPESICGLHKLSVLNISDCVGMSKMPERMGELRGLRALDMRGCGRLQELPPSVEDLCELKDVICDKEMSFFWKSYENHLTNLKVHV